MHVPFSFCSAAVAGFAVVFIRSQEPIFSRPIRIRTSFRHFTRAHICIMHFCCDYGLPRHRDQRSGAVVGVRSTGV